MLCVFNFNRMKKRISMGSTHWKVKRSTNYNTFAISPKKIVSENYMNFAAYRVLLDGNWSKTNNSTIKHFNHKLFNIIQNTQKPHTLLKLYTLNSTSGSIFSSCFTQIQITLYYGSSKRITHSVCFSHLQFDIDEVNRLERPRQRFNIHVNTDGAPTND